MNDSGPDGYATNGFNENLSLFQQGKCGMWIDATVAASFVTNPTTRPSPTALASHWHQTTKVLSKRANWLWAWALAIPAGTQKEAEAKQFIEWATSKDYIELVAANEGWANVPPGARTSLYENPDYQEVPFAQMTLDSINCRLIRTTRQLIRFPMSVSSSPRSRSLQASQPKSARNSRQLMPVSRPSKRPWPRRRRSPTKLWKLLATAKHSSQAEGRRDLSPLGSPPPFQYTVT